MYAISGNLAKSIVSPAGSWSSNSILFKNSMEHILILLQDPEPTGLKMDFALLSKRCKTIILTLLAVVVVLVQGKAVETSALVAAHRVLTDVLTSSVVDGTFVLI